jgi:hypothetical protein
MMFKRVAAALLATMSCMSATAQSVYKETLEVTRADGARVLLINPAKSSTGERFYLYSEGQTVACPGETSSGTRVTNKPQTMFNMAVVLGTYKQNAKYINDENRSFLMPDSSGNFFVVSLPTAAELSDLYSGTPLKRVFCNLDTLVTPRGGVEFLSSTPNWENHTTINLENGLGRQLSDWEPRPVALRVVHMAETQACFFEHFNFNGRYKCFGTGDIGWVGQYADGSDANDTFSSFVIGKNCRVTMFEHGDYYGAETILNPTQEAMRTQGQLNASNGWTWNDKISSLKVACK